MQARPSLHIGHYSEPTVICASMSQTRHLALQRSAIQNLWDIGRCSTRDMEKKQPCAESQQSWTRVSSRPAPHLIRPKDGTWELTVARKVLRYLDILGNQSPEPRRLTDFSLSREAAWVVPVMFAPEVKQPEAWIR